jgi:hypothetical protein
MPTGGGVPPAVRNLARSVIVRNRSVSSARPSAVALNEITAVWRCDRGRMPAWYLPWNGTGGSTPACAFSSVRWLAGAGRVARYAYPPAAPATAPAAPAPRAPRRNARRRVPSADGTDPDFAASACPASACF